MTTKNLKLVKRPTRFLTEGNFKWWFVPGCFTTFIALKTQEDIIFYSWWIWLVLSIPLLSALVYWQRNDFLDELNDRKPLARTGAFLVLTISYTLFSFLVSSALVVPFNIYMVQSVRNEPHSTICLPIKDVGVSSRSGGYITFEFKGEKVTQYFSKKSAAELEKNDAFKNDDVCLKVSPAPFGTYVIKDWKVVPR